MGTDIASEVHRQSEQVKQTQTKRAATHAALADFVDVGAIVPPCPLVQPLPDFTVPFERIARTIGLTVALARKVEERAPPLAIPRAPTGRLRPEHRPRRP